MLSAHDLTTPVRTTTATPPPSAAAIDRTRSSGSSGSAVPKAAPAGQRMFLNNFSFAGGLFHMNGVFHIIHSYAS